MRSFEKRLFDNPASFQVADLSKMTRTLELISEFPQIDAESFSVAFADLECRTTGYRGALSTFGEANCVHPIWGLIQLQYVLPTSWQSFSQRPKSSTSLSSDVCTRRVWNTLERWSGGIFGSAVDTRNGFHINSYCVKNVKAWDRRRDKGLDVYGKITDVGVWDLRGCWTT